MQCIKHLLAVLVWITCIQPLAAWCTSCAACHAVEQVGGIWVVHTYDPSIWVMLWIMCINTCSGLSAGDEPARLPLAQYEHTSVDK